MECSNPTPNVGPARTMLAARLILALQRSAPTQPGSTGVLVFLPGLRDIEDLDRTLRDEATREGVSGGALEVLALHSMVAPDMQARVSQARVCNTLDPGFLCKTSNDYYFT